MASSELRNLPSVDRVLSDRRVQKLVEEYSHPAVLDLVRAQLDDARGRIGNGTQAPDLDQVVASVEERAASSWRERPGAVINATGVVLHTNLGRAPLSTESLEAIDRASRGYSDLELDLETGKRGGRQAYLSRMLCQLTGAEAAFVVNNNASALLLGLAAIAGGSEVIVSRGEAVEIGGGFRIPDVLRQSGTELVEVGTTNRTYARDFEAAITERTGGILLVHSSNFRVTGFIHSPQLAELVQLGNQRGIPVLHDLGSGCLLDTTAFGLAHEPMPQESMAAGASLAFFSGDKLLGGPQAGIIVGDASLIGQVSKYPLARAVRIDKLSMAALGATLLHYVREEATERVPVWRMISEAPGDLESQGRGVDRVAQARFIGGERPLHHRRRQPARRGAAHVPPQPRCRRRRRGAGIEAATRQPAGGRPHRGRPRPSRPQDRPPRAGRKPAPSRRRSADRPD